MSKSIVRQWEDALTLSHLIKMLEEAKFCGEECPSFHGGSCACRNSDDPRDRSE